MKRKPLTAKNGEVRELTADDFKQMRPAREALSPELYAMLTKKKPGQRGNQKRPTKKPVTIRLDPDVLRYFQSTGHGWQSRINNFLKAAVENLPI